MLPLFNRWNEKLSFPVGETAQLRETRRSAIHTKDDPIPSLKFVGMKKKKGFGVLALFRR